MSGASIRVIKLPILPGAPLRSVLARGPCDVLLVRGESRHVVSLHCERLRDAEGVTYEVRAKSGRARTQALGASRVEALAAALTAIGEALGAGT